MLGEWDQTTGFKNSGWFVGAAQRSYREAVNVFNRSRHQQVGGTPLNTLRDGAQAEGLKVLDFVDKKTQAILNAHDFNPQGVPEAHCAITQKVAEPAYLEGQTIQKALSGVLEKMSKKGFSAADMEQVQEAASCGKVYEQVEKCVYVHIDDVGVKEQKSSEKKAQPRN
ncbi:MAG: hypothetical protein IPL15_11605 [Comamonadaceae bacterium]|nr:hypothetical protein [Comamonadaceae bacterium]